MRDLVDLPTARRRPRTAAERRRLPIVVALVAGPLAGWALVGCSSSESSVTAPAAVLADDPAAARVAAAAAVRRLRTEPVETHASGRAGGQQFEVTATADPAAGRMRLDELLNDVIRTELIIDEGTLYANIYPSADEPPPFTVTDPGDQTPDFVDEVFTAAGRVFGDVDVLAAVLERAPATVFELGGRDDGDGVEQRGLRLVLDAHDVGRLLADEQLERAVTVPEPGAETTTIELWFDHRLRELRAMGLVYEDGEPIPDVDLVVEYEPTDEVRIEVPTATIP